MQKVSDILDANGGTVTTPAKELPANGTEQTATCACGAPYTQRFFHVLETWFPDECPACDQARVEQRKREIAERDAAVARATAQARRERIREQIPPIFLDTDRLHPAMQAPRIQEILRWDFGPRGILAHGRTGGGKSRACYLLCQREAEFGRDVRMFAPAEFARQMAQAYRSHREEQFHAELQRADLVFLDDLGKEKITAKVQEELFALVDYRVTHRKPTLITTNFAGDKLVERFEDGDTAVPFVERLRKHFQCVHVLAIETE